jgi:predicted nucleic acid-binding protein
MTKYYVDSCIWLNLFKKEGDARKGEPYWKIADQFIKETLREESNESIYSAPIMREIRNCLKNENVFRTNERLIKEHPRTRFTEVTKEDKEFARRIESENSFELSFFDCIHIAICKREGSILVTRDKELLKRAEKYITAKKPEDFNQ